MRPAFTAIVLTIACTVAGCDVIYERPELDSLVDFGEPYLTRDEGALTAPAGAREAPYVTSDDRLIVDVTYRADCVASQFILQLNARDQETIDLWLVHNAAAGSCATGDAISRRLVFELPANAARFRRQVLLTPDRGSIVLERELG